MEEGYEGGEGNVSKGASQYWFQCFILGVDLVANGTSERHQVSSYPLLVFTRMN